MGTFKAVLDIDRRIMADIDNTQDIIDVRDIIARFENLQASIEYFDEQGHRPDDEEVAERDTLASLLEDLKGNGGAEQWKGDWYPVTLIRDSYFEDYARELAYDIHGARMSDAQWPFTCIDWEAAVRDLQIDYTSVEYDGITYWYL